MAHHLDQFHMKHDFPTATNSLLAEQNTDFVHFLCTNILNWPLNLHGKKKPYLAKTLTEPIDVIVALLSAPNLNANFACNKRQLLTALWSNVIQASSEWQYSSPMMLGDPVGAAIIFQDVRATLDHNPVQM